jgi:hypothetical protein
MSQPMRQEPRRDTALQDLPLPFGRSILGPEDAEFEETFDEEGVAEEMEGVPMDGGAGGGFDGLDKEKRKGGRKKGGSRVMDW